VTQYIKFNVTNKLTPLFSEEKKCNFLSMTYRFHHVAEVMHDHTTAKAICSPNLVEH